MKLRITATIGHEQYAVNLHQPRDISIPLRFDGEQPCLFGAAPAHSEPYRAGSFVGDVRQGGSCNCDTVRLTPHLNGTHTECVGHIAHARLALYGILQDTLIPATLVTVAPMPALESEDTYDPGLRLEDNLITRAALEQTLSRRNAAFLESVVIRTTPNERTKITRNYDKTPPAFFSIEAIRYLVALGVEHLVTDLPSIDRLEDEGKLTNHHIYWDVPLGHHPTEHDVISFRTITELVYAPDSIPDGEYLLNLQIAPFDADASPSRPILYELTRL